MIDVLVPLEQEGAEAVVANWLRALGDFVKPGEPLVELETDKVAVEIAAPAAGRLAEILVEKGGKARPGAVLARLAPAEAEAEAPPEPAKPQQAPPSAPARDMSHWHSPAVRKALAETGLDPASIRGGGREGRLTRADVDRAAAEAAAQREAPAPQSESRLIPHDAMRLAVARNMLRSAREAPQVTAVFEADFTAIMAHRARHKAAFEAEGVALTYTAYLVLAAARAMAAMPQVNSRWRDEALEVFRDVNIGVGTALCEAGLVAPVLRRVQDLSLRGVAARLQDLTRRARAGALTPEDMRGGAFTISNHGVSGSLLAAPVLINPPQTAILGVGKLEKRVVVREIDGADAILIRPMAYVTLTIDHRVLDGHQTNAWLAAFVAALEGWAD